MVAWRAAGINYVRFSQLAAGVLRKCARDSTQTAATAAKKAEGTIKMTNWEAGKPVKAA